jgi:hypothetical protein
MLCENAAVRRPGKRKAAVDPAYHTLFELMDPAVFAMMNGTADRMPSASDVRAADRFGKIRKINQKAVDKRSSFCYCLAVECCFRAASPF